MPALGLVIGHMSARYDTPDVHLEQAKATFPKVTAARDGMVIPVSGRL